MLLFFSALMLENASEYEKKNHNKPVQKLAGALDVLPLN